MWLFSRLSSASATIASAQPGWTPPFDLAAGTTSTRDPVFGIDSAGNAVALWTEGTEIRASHFLASSSVWSAPVRVSPAGDQVRFPSVDVNGSGRAIAAWSNRGPSGTAATVQASSFSTQTMQWSAPQTLATDVPNGGAQVELDDAGNAMAMWKGSNGYRDMVARYDAASATWGAPVSLTFADNASAGLYVAGSGDAMVMVAYSGPQAGGAPDVHRYQASTATWHQPVRFTGPGTGQVPGAWLAAGTSGRFLAVWLSFTGTVPSLQSSLFDPVVGAFSAPTLVATGYLRGTVALGDEVGLFVGYDSVTRMVKSARFDVASRTWSALTDFGTAGLERPETGPGSAIAIRAAMTPAGAGSRHVGRACRRGQLCEDGALRAVNQFVGAIRGPCASGIPQSCRRANRFGSSRMAREAHGRSTKRSSVPLRRRDHLTRARPSRDQSPQRRIVLDGANCGPASHWLHGSSEPRPGRTASRLTTDWDAAITVRFGARRHLLRESARSDQRRPGVVKRDPRRCRASANTQRAREPDRDGQRQCRHVRMAATGQPGGAAVYELRARSGYRTRTLESGVDATR